MEYVVEYKEVMVGYYRYTADHYTEAVGKFLEDLSQGKVDLSVMELHHDYIDVEEAPL